ncbi:uncharacterized protein LOC135350695 isoform X2 [Halichondria panicea]|uniref:uncharacterized protein LOC135350695 isoform X2 n=1 Tax=Halichondria panicea TaxID=6063 RepID=UPI00312BBFBA
MASSLRSSGRRLPCPPQLPPTQPPPCLPPPPPSQPPPCPPPLPPSQPPPCPPPTHAPPKPPPPRTSQLDPPAPPDDKPDAKTSPDKTTKEQIPKGGFLLGKRSLGSITMKLKSQSEAKKSKTDSEQNTLSKPLSRTVAAAFGSDSEDEEEMPADAKLRMRNVGKNTPTSSGPNSFNKTKSGFSVPRNSSWRNEDQ